VQWAFDTYATGDYTLVQLTEQLDAMGLTSIPTATRAAKPLSRSTVNRMLRNPYYIGVVTYQGVQYEGRHPHLIDKPTWYRVQAILDAHLAGEKRRKYPHYLKGSLFCSACGSRLCFDRKVNRHGSEYEYFFCVGRHQKRTGCVRRYMSVQELEERVEEKWRGVRLAKPYADALETILRQELQQQRETNEHARVVARRKLLSLHNQQDKLMSAHYEGAVPLDVLRREQQRLSKAIHHAEAQLLAAQVSDEQVERPLGLCMEFAKQCDDVYATAPPQLRRQMNQAMFERFLVEEDGDLVGELAGPFKVLLNHRLLTDGQMTIEQTDAALRPGGVTYHRASDWADGFPAWLASTRRRRLARLYLCQGSKENHLAEGVGFEPTEGCPSHALQACRFVRSRIPPEPGDRRGRRRPARSTRQATRRHPSASAESCFLPDLTRFTGARRAGPGAARAGRPPRYRLRHRSVTTTQQTWDTAHARNAGR
jgi:hypothetical protein